MQHLTHTLISYRQKTLLRHLAVTGEDKHAYMDSVDKSEGKKPLGRPRRRWEDMLDYVLMKCDGSAYS
jgi:hypothetical protein